MNRIERLKEFLVTTPNDCFLKHALALEYIKEGNDGRAKELFDEVLVLDENYIGSYYHLAKLLERAGQEAAAIKVYEAGMERANASGDTHAFGELRSAYEDLTY